MNKNVNSISSDSEKVSRAELKGDIKKLARERKFQTLLSTLIFVIGLIIVMSFAQPILTDDVIDIPKLAILLVLTIYGLIIGRWEGMDWAQKRTNGLFQRTLKTFNDVYNQIQPIRAYFSQWCDILYLKKRKSRILKILSNWGIDDERVLDLTTDELPELINKHYRKEWLGNSKYPPSRHADKYKKGDIETEPYVSYFDPYTEKQVEVIKACIEGYFEIDKLPASYFLISYSNSIKDAYYNASTAGKQKNSITITSFTSKILTLILVSVILTSVGFQIYENQGQPDQIVQAIYDTFSRLFTLGTALVFGFYTGTDLIKIDRYYLAFKVETLKDYLDEYEKGIFRPTDRIAERKQEYEKEQKVLEESLKNVIDPEVVQNVNNGVKTLEYKEKEE